MIRKAAPKRRSAPVNPNNPNAPQSGPEAGGMEVDETQEVMGNGVAVQQMSAAPPPEPVNPWGFDLFGGGYRSQIDGLEWDNGVKMTADVDGGIRAKPKTSQKTTNLGEGDFGPVNWTHKNTMQTYKDSDIDMDVGVGAERTRQGEFDGMTYKSTNNRNVDIGGALEHKNGDDIADGRLGIDMATKHSEKGKLKQGNFTVEQSRQTGHSLSGDWKDVRGNAETGGKYSNSQKDHQKITEKLENGETIRTRDRSAATKIAAEKSKTGSSFRVDQQFGGARSYDHQSTDAAGVQHANAISGQFDVKANGGRHKNGNLAGGIDLDTSGEFSTGTTRQTDAGLEEKVISGSGSLLQNVDLSKTKKGIQFANETDANAEVAMSKALTHDIENGKQTNTVYGGANGRAQVNRAKSGEMTQQYDLGGHAGYKIARATTEGDKKKTSSLDTKLSVDGQSKIAEDGEKKHSITTALSTKGKTKTSTKMDDGKKDVTWSGNAGGSHEVQINPNGNVHLIKGDVGVDRDVKRTHNLEDGKRTNDFNVGGSLSENMRINKDGKTSHRITGETHAGAGTKRVYKLDDGQRTNTAKGTVDASRTLKLNQDGTRTHEVRYGAGGEIGTERERELSDGTRTTGGKITTDASHTTRTDADGAKTQELRGSLGAQGNYERVKNLENGSNATNAAADVKATKVVRIGKTGEKAHELSVGANITGSHLQKRTLDDGTLERGVSGSVHAGDTITTDANGVEAHEIDVNAAVDAHRDRTRTLADGTVDTKLKSHLEGGDKIQIAADGAKTHTLNGKWTGDASRSRTVNLDDGKRVTTIGGNALLQDTSVLNSDGSKTHNIKAEAGLNGGVKRDQTLADGSRTRELKGNISAGDEIAIAADKSQTHTLTGKVGASASNTRVTDFADGRETAKLEGSAGTRVKHVVRSGSTNLDLESKVGHTRSREQKISDAINETRTTGHTASMNNDIDIEHGNGQDKEWGLKHNKTTVGYTFDKGTDRTETFADRTEKTGRTHKVNVDGSIAENSQGVNAGYTLGRSQSVQMNQGSKTAHEETIGVKGGATRNVEKAEDGSKSSSYNLTAGLSREQKDELVRKSDAGTFTEKTSQKDGLDLGFQTKDRLGTLGLSRENTLSRKNEEGIERTEKAKRSMNFDTKGNAGLKTESEVVRYRKQEELSDRLDLTTEKHKTTLGAGLTRKVDKDAGTASYGANADASYTMLSQKVKFNEKATYEKIKGLSLGSKDTTPDGKVRILQKSLNKLGYRLVEDGEYGQGTLNAVKDFAAKKGIAVDEKGTITEDLGWAMPKVGLLGNGASAEAGYEIGKAEANAKADAVFTKDQIKIKGAAGAKLTMIGGNAKIDLPVYNFTLGGERIQAAVTMGVNAAVLAELNGQVDIDLEKGSDKFNAGFGGKAEAFVGAKGGAEIGGEFRWLRKSGEAYAEDFKKFAKSIPGKADDWIVDQLPPEFWPQLSSVLVGSGTSRVLYAKAGVEGRAGLGASANFSGGFKDGMVHFSGDMSGTLGLGGGVKTDFGVHMVDGARLGGIWSIRGINYISDHLDGVATWTGNALREVQKRIDNYMEAKKKKGGIGGFFAKTVDFIGDDLFNLW